VRQSQCMLRDLGQLRTHTLILRPQIRCVEAGVFLPEQAPWAASAGFSRKWPTINFSLLRSAFTLGSGRRFVALNSSPASSGRRSGIKLEPNVAGLRLSAC
jgi:hypothetical protein